LDGENMGERWGNAMKYHGFLDDSCELSELLAKNPRPSDDCRNLPHMAQEPGWPVGSTNLQASDDTPGEKKQYKTHPNSNSPSKCCRDHFHAVGELQQLWEHSIPTGLKDDIVWISI
jgi:hypothetical protein